MSLEGKKAIIRRLVELLNEGKPDALEQIFAPDYVRHDPGDLLHDVGVAECKAAFARIRRAFAQRQGL
jgi:hypothetical protein